jgi:hypothetical protein
VPAGHPDVVAEQVPRAVGAECGIRPGQQLVHRARITRHRLSPGQAGQCFRAGGQIRGGIAIEHIQRAEIGAAGFPGMADATAHPPAAAQPRADERVGVLRRRLLQSLAERTIRAPLHAAESFHLGQFDEQFRVVRCDLRRFGQEARRVAHRGHGAGVLGGLQQLADCLLVLAGQPEVAGDLGRPYAAPNAPGAPLTGIRLLALPAQYLGQFAVQARPDGIGDLVVDHVAQQGMPEPGPSLTCPEQARPECFRCGTQPAPLRAGPGRVRPPPRTR